MRLITLKESFDRVGPISGMRAIDVCRPGSARLPKGRMVTRNGGHAARHRLRERHTEALGFRGDDDRSSRVIPSCHLRVVKRAFDYDSAMRATPLGKRLEILTVDGRISDDAQHGARLRESEPGLEDEVVSLVGIEVGDAQQLGPLV